MKVDEGNRIVAKYMGCEIVDDWGVPTITSEEFNTTIMYSESLDALVPVWEKMKTERIELCLEFGQVIYMYGEQCSGDGIMSIQEAALISTAKAIQELT